MSIMHRKVVQEITPQLIVKYVLPKREIVKICVAVALTEMFLHSPMKRGGLLNVTYRKANEKVGKWEEVDLSEDKQ